ncbi:MAG: polyphosphate kinase 1 [Acidimicrobiia bacterium]
MTPRLDAPALLDRELSWLDFNARVLALAAHESVPLLERAKFMAIFSSNLDEFFQVRVASLKDQQEMGVISSTEETALTDSLERIRHRVSDLVDQQSDIFSKVMLPELAGEGIHIEHWNDLPAEDQIFCTGLFERQLYPVLTPLAVDPSHPFPYVSNLSLNLAVLVADPVTDETRFARVKIPSLFQRLVRLGGGARFVPIEEVIAAHLDRLFPGMVVTSISTFRVTRNADVDYDDESADVLAAVEQALKDRTRSSMSVRLEIDRSAEAEVVELLCRELEIEHHDAFLVDGFLDFTGLAELWRLPRSDLKDPVWHPVDPFPSTSPDRVDHNWFRVLRKRDVLLHHPYESFTTSVEDFVTQASRDPKVLAIKQTIYRTSDDSGLIQALAQAAQSGKQVVVLVELKARFDELSNIEAARMLEEAGVHVAYGVVGLKTHAKAVLVVRQDADGIRRYCHLGTGNYNPRTAATYEDLGLLTADPEIGADLSLLFNQLTGYSRGEHMTLLWTAPTDVRRRLLARIEQEAALSERGYISMKVNALLDTAVIDALYAASRAGCRIDLAVRGICCLVPGLSGHSDHIRVRSIVGRFLEHSRVYRFGADPETADWLIGSADAMPRNLDRRVELLIPIRQADLRKRLARLHDAFWADTDLAWELGSDAEWRRVSPNGAPPCNLHVELMSEAVDAATKARRIGGVG